MKTHTEHICSKNHTYTIRVGGVLDGVNTRDPVGYKPCGQAFEPNRYVKMENVGDTPAVNPWIIVNGRRDWRSTDAILREILPQNADEEEKARAIWEFARTHRYHFTTADDEVKDTVKMLNCYGYTLCWDEAYTVSNLWQAAGLKIRRGYPHGHCTTEVYYDGAYHLLDSDEHLMPLLRDNRTIASEADLSRDHDLMKRAHAYGILQPENRATSEAAAALFFHTGPRPGGRPAVGSHRMDLTLRPGEALIWEWEDRGKYHGYRDRPPRLANGRMCFAPRPDHPPETAEHATAVPGEGLQPAAPGREARVVYSVLSPYVIVGGTLTLDLHRRGETDAIAVDLSFDGKTWTPAWTAAGTGRLTPSISLDPHIPPAGPARYAYRVRLCLRAAENPADVRLSGLTLETDLQMAPLSLPALEVGENSIRYTSDTDAQVRITHGWKEKNAAPAPVPCRRPQYPEDGAVVPGTRITFAWEPVENAVDYHFELSDRPDVKYRLSPTFEKLISRTPAAGKPEWTIPGEGLLNPGQTCYWRIRPRNRDGLWGAWSPTWRFTPQAPGIPLDPTAEPDPETRTVTLRWAPNPDGTPPDHYEIYGSDERGFTASREPYPVLVGKSCPPETFPSNRIGLTRNTVFRVAGPHVENGNRAFYRVIAVDADGVRSGPSDYAEAPRPFIVSRPPEQIPADRTSAYRVQTLRSLGDLRCESRDGKYYASAFRDGDAPRFLIDEGPPWLALDEHTGLLTATPSSEHIGLHTVTLRVQNGQGGEDMQGFDLRVVEPTACTGDRPVAPAR